MRRGENLKRGRNFCDTPPGVARGMINGKYWSASGSAGLELRLNEAIVRVQSWLDQPCVQLCDRLTMKWKKPVLSCEAGAGTFDIS
jgi:hypothetical protein